ncbi:uncharacterized protein LOC101901047 [Musca domestica]|uniref:Uncharacterized protein LOC101901047 n=1 Tax=Musca domestica TaxID=7370 RepID=A0A9J7IFR2_MUSDO|nr:uncharacterized protein LOC101901047 [Musca domestica]XP_058978244.1 uncharacterized protein LOC101901047 [Musca domestica]
MKRITLVVAAVVLLTCSNAEKLSKEDGKKAVVEDNYSKAGEDKLEADIAESGSSKKSKEVHKRGVFHYGTLASHAAWPKSYAAHYGYGVHLPTSFSVAPIAASHIHVPGSIKYHSGIHYKAVVPSGVAAVSSTVLPAVSTLSPVHAHQAAASVPYVIRPGGAVVQSYSVNYPHHKSIVPVKAVHAYGTVAHGLNSIQPVHHVPAQAIPHIPAQPIQPVVQTFVQAAPVAQPVPSVGVVAQFPSGNLGPVLPDIQATPSFGSPPTFSVVSGESAAPVVPPAVPNVPVVAPQPQPPNVFYPVNIQPPIAQQPPAFVNVQPAIAQQPPTFVNVQPAIAQQPPTFVNYNPNVQVPSFVPVGGRPNQNQPDFGSNEAAPQIPVQPTAAAQPEPELPAIQPEPGQQPWKPVLYQPPTVQSEINRPSNTLLPPYGNTPAEGYLPPATNQKGRQEYRYSNNLLDLSEADIQNIFQQASIAAQNDHNHAHVHPHTIHKYHSHY